MSEGKSHKTGWATVGNPYFIDSWEGSATHRMHEGLYNHFNLYNMSVGISAYWHFVKTEIPVLGRSFNRYARGICTVAKALHFLFIWLFVSMFLSYPSGNIAIIVIPSNVKEAICIVQEDKDHNAEILAIFGSSGKATCYHPNGMVWYVF